MKVRAFLILLVCAGGVMLASYLGMEYLGFPTKVYKIVLAIISVLLLASAFLIKDEERKKYVEVDRRGGIWPTRPAKPPPGKPKQPKR